MLFLICFAVPLAAEENPFAKLDRRTRIKVQSILDEPTVTVPCGERTIKTKEAVYDFLIRNLDLTGRLVNKLGVGNYEITRKDKGRFLVDDRAGAVATITPLTSFRRSGLLYRLFLAEGHFKLPLGTRVHGTGVIILGYKQTEKGVYTNADVFFKARAGTLHLLGKKVRGVLIRVLRKKAVLFVQAAREVSEATTRSPKKLHQLMKGDELISPKLAAEFAEKFLPKLD